MPRVKKTVAEFPFKKTELQIENEIFSWLAWMKFKFWKTKVKGEPHTGKGGKVFFKKSMNAGFQDLTGCVKGRFIAIEVKRPGEKLRPDQKVQEEEVLAAGGIYLKAECLEDVIEKFMEENLL